SGMVFRQFMNNSIIIIQGGNNITINGLTFRNLQNGAGVYIHGGPAYFEIDYQGTNAFPETGPAYGNKVINCEVYNLGVAADNIPPYVWYGGINAVGDVRNTTFANNVIHDVGGVAISIVVLQLGPNHGADNSVIKNNFVYNLNKAPGAGDTGGIYLIDRMQTSQNWSIENNYIRDFGSRGHTTKGIYIDDFASNIKIIGNVVAGLGTYSMQLHNSNNIEVKGNIFDLSPVGDQYLLLYQNQGQSGGMTGNSVTNNIIIGNYPGNGLTDDVYYSGWGNSFTYPDVRNNLYWNYSGGQIYITGDIQDSSPVRQNPQLSGWDYRISPSSPALTSSVGFTPLIGGWGPPGFVIPQSGTPPSSPTTPIGPTPTPTPTPTPNSLLGDINLDHIVNSLDWSVMSSNWLTNHFASDINKDGVVNSLDFSIMSSNWLKTW
ncbi:MAG: dockerin type I domain-containing protein, partial [Minisyncoccia bacterium]